MRASDSQLIIHVGVRIEIGFQKTEYAVSESSGSLTAIVVAEGNFSSTFQLNISAANGTASCKY